MNIDDEFPSKYLKASDLKGRTTTVRIREIVRETVGQDSRIVFYFSGKDKGMICNRTNAMTLSEAWGAETNNWLGGEIEIFSTKVPYQGKLTDGLRVRPMPNRAAAPASTVRMAPNARDRAMAEHPNAPVEYASDQPAPTRGAPVSVGYEDPFNDDVPF
jgi:hypothetical protein